MLLKFTSIVVCMLGGGGYWRRRAGLKGSDAPSTQAVVMVAGIVLLLGTRKGASP